MNREGESELRNASYMGLDPDGSPYARYFVPHLESVQPLRYAIAASAACHLGARVANKQLEIRSLVAHFGEDVSEFGRSVKIETENKILRITDHQLLFFFVNLATSNGSTDFKLGFNSGLKTNDLVILGSYPLK